jgi:hypothetical protein
VEGVVAAATAGTAEDGRDPKMEVVTGEIDLYRPCTRSLTPCHVVQKRWQCMILCMVVRYFNINFVAF